MASNNAGCAFVAIDNIPVSKSELVVAPVGETRSLGISDTFSDILDTALLKEQK